MKYSVPFLFAALLVSNVHPMLTSLSPNSSPTPSPKHSSFYKVVSEHQGVFLGATAITTAAVVIGIRTSDINPTQQIDKSTLLEHTYNGECLKVLARYIYAHTLKHNPGVFCRKCNYLIRQSTRIAVFKCCCSIYCDKCQAVLTHCLQPACKQKDSNSDRVFYTPDHEIDA
jgi:hypothetical protein